MVAMSSDFLQRGRDRRAAAVRFETMHRRMDKSPATSAITTPAMSTPRTVARLNLQAPRRRAGRQTPEKAGIWPHPRPAIATIRVCEACNGWFTFRPEVSDETTDIARIALDRGCAAVFTSRTRAAC